MCSTYSNIKIMLDYVKEELLVKKDFTSLRDACILLFRIVTLNRCSEVATIGMEHLGMENFTYKWFGSKNDKVKVWSESNTIPESSKDLDFRDALTRYLEVRNSGVEFLFVQGPKTRRNLVFPRTESGVSVLST